VSQDLKSVFGLAPSDSKLVRWNEGAFSSGSAWSLIGPSLVECPGLLFCGPSLTDECEVCLEVELNPPPQLAPSLKCELELKVRGSRPNAGVTNRATGQTANRGTKFERRHDWIGF
jgi:hypothetical protein